MKATLRDGPREIASAHALARCAGGEVPWRAPAIFCLLLALLFVVAAPTGAAAQTITSSDLARLRDLDGLSVSPDGRWAVFQVREADPVANAYRQDWFVVSTSGGAARAIADGGDVFLPSSLGRINGFILQPAPVWSPDSRWIAYLRRENDRTQVWRARADGRRSEQITHAEGDARAVVFSADGRRLLFETEPSQPQIATALAVEGRSGFLFDERFLPAYSTTPTMPRGASLLNQMEPSASEAAGFRTFVVDFARRGEREATQAEAAEYAALIAAPAPQGRERFRESAARSPGGALAWTEARDPERQGGMAPLTIVAQPTGAAEPTVCTAPECTSQMMGGVWWRNEREVLFVRRETPHGPHRALYAWRMDEAAPRQVLRTSEVFAYRGLWDCAVAQDRLICFYEQADHPRRLVAISLDDGAIETLYEPNPGFARFELGASPQPIRFRSPSGVESDGYLVLPPNHSGGERLPLVIVTYACGGFLRGGVGDEYPVYPFAAAGFAVLCFNTPYDFAEMATMDWETAQNRDRGLGDPEKKRVQEGLEAAIRELDRMGVIDPGRVGITGLSFGAETVMYALFNMPRLTAAISSGSEIGPSGTFLYGPAFQELSRPWGLDSPLSERWDALSITRNAHRVRAPLLMNVTDHEMLDAVHPFSALEEAGRAVEMYVYPDSYHIKHQPAHRLSIYNRNIDWMNFWLRGVEDPDPAKAAQYANWRAMRDNQCRLFTGADAPWYCRPGVPEH